MSQGVFVGFGFGAIQGGLFLYEAFRSGNFRRLVVAEVVPDLVAAIRTAGGQYGLNVATRGGIEQHTVRGIEIFNPNVPADRAKLVEALAEATEISTALPSVQFFDKGGAASIVSILAEALARKAAARNPARAVIYTAENHNRAAEILEEALVLRWGAEAARILESCQVLNTVIGKMSGVVTDPGQIAEQKLLRVTPEATRCFLVEEFNRILITRIRLKDFRRGIAVFEEKNDLLPFEEAKLYGHNATHALLGYLARRKGYTYIADAAADRPLMEIARRAFLEESGQALCRLHKGVDPLFTTEHYARYVEELLVRMTNPHLRDAVERVIRDPRRKLGWDDRLVGTMRLALEQGIAPKRYALGAAAALEWLAETDHATPDALLDQIWAANKDHPESRRIRDLLAAAARELKEGGT